ncbi:MATE family efflux transporter [Paenibacillus alkalitolerans]|uniref:MATE family efflux transporter n=1 Tax=Paenibacillus alkalitolerans TaxID=2799335 RepID=UPI0018F2F81C|nr:MATE family efflux transporter [Paenibacillus alkalitolerans]
MDNKSQLLTGPIGKTLFLFSVPILLGNALQSLNGLVNSIWVGQFLGQQALAATSTANILMFFLISSIFGLAMATVIMIGTNVGSQNIGEAKKVVGTSAVFFLVISLFLAIIGAVFTSQILTLMNTPSDIKNMAVAYTRILFIGIPFSFLFNYAMAVLRGAGDSKTPFYFLILSVGLDVALNPVFILGLGPIPELGISGSSLAAAIAQFLSLLLFILYLYTKKYFLRITKHDLHVLTMDWDIVKYLSVKGIPMGLQMIFSTASVLALIHLVNSFGSEAAAAFGAVNQIIAYIQIPGIAIGGALTSMVAQSVGARKWERVHRAAAAGIGFHILLTGVIVFLCIVFRDELLSLFLPGAGRSFDIAKHIIIVTLWSYVLFGVTFVIAGVVRATGAVIAPMLITIITLWGIQIPLAYYLANQNGLAALWWSFPIAFTVSTAVFSVYYLSGKWMKQPATTS